MKSTPKSCGCFSCRRGRRSGFGHLIHRMGDRALRHAARVVLHRITQGAPIEDAERISPAPHTDYTD